MTQPGLTAVYPRISLLCSQSPGPSSLISVPCHMERGLGSTVAQDCHPEVRVILFTHARWGTFLTQTELRDLVVPSSSSEVPNFWPSSVDPSRPNPEGRFYLSPHGQNGLDTFPLCTIGPLTIYSTADDQRHSATCVSTSASRWASTVYTRGLACCHWSPRLSLGCVKGSLDFPVRGRVVGLP